MFAIFFTCVISTFIIFSALFARMLKRLFSHLITKHLYIKVFAFNIVLLAILSLSKYIPGQSRLLSICQQLIIIVFVSEIFTSAVIFAFDLINKLYRHFINVKVDESRRKFLYRAALIPVEGAVLYGNLVEKNDIILNKYTLPLAKTDVWRGLKIGHLTDVHLGSYFSLAKLQQTLDRFVELSADILAVTGDIFDEDKINAVAVALMGRYCDKFSYGIYYCWGNHEYMRNMTLIKRELAKTNIHMLINKSFTLTRGTDKLTLIGVDYPHVRSQFAKLSDDYMKQAMENVPQDGIKILLAHHSDFIDNAFDFDIDLALTGHTHGGQLGLLGYPLVLGFKYMRGMFRNNNHYGYVSTGAGSWFPFRLGCPPEITLFTIV